MLRALFQTLQLVTAPLHAVKLKTAAFAGDCLQCIEQAFDEIDGIVGSKPFKDPVIIPIEPVRMFYPAGEYHQGLWGK